MVKMLLAIALMLPAAPVQEPTPAQPFAMSEAERRAVVDMIERLNATNGWLTAALATCQRARSANFGSMW